MKKSKERYLGHQFESKIGHDIEDDNCELKIAQPSYVEIAQGVFIDAEHTTLD